MDAHTEWARISGERCAIHRIAGRDSDVRITARVAARHISRIGTRDPSLARQCAIRFDGAYALTIREHAARP